MHRAVKIPNLEVQVYYMRDKADHMYRCLTHKSLEFSGSTALTASDAQFIYNALATVPVSGRHYCLHVHAA